MTVLVLTVNACLGCLSSRIDTKFKSCNTREHLTWLYSSISLGVWTVEREESKHSTAASMPCRARFEMKNSRLWNRLDGFSFDFLGFAKSIENGQIYDHIEEEKERGWWKEKEGGTRSTNSSSLDSTVYTTCRYSMTNFTIKEFTWWEQLFLEHPVIAVQCSSHTLKPTNCFGSWEC